MRPATMALKPSCWVAAPLVPTVTGPLADGAVDEEAYPLVATVDAVGYGATGVVTAGTSGVETG